MQLIHLTTSSTLVFDLLVIFIYPVNPKLQFVSIVSVIIWLISAIIFFITIEPEYRSTFFYGNNFKDTVRIHFWNHAIFASRDWGHASLDGDLDANRAMLLTYYFEFDLPIKEATSWINENKIEWENNPPLWYNEDWKSKIPKSLLNACYT